MLRLFALVLGVLAFVLFLSVGVWGTLGPGWEGTKDDRTNFWYIFLPSLLLLLFIAFMAGRITG